MLLCLFAGLSNNDLGSSCANREICSSKGAPGSNKQGWRPSWEVHRNSWVERKKQASLWWNSFIEGGQIVMDRVSPGLPPEIRKSGPRCCVFVKMPKFLYIWLLLLYFGNKSSWWGYKMNPECGWLPYPYLGNLCLLYIGILWKKL